MLDIEGPRAWGRPCSHLHGGMMAPRWWHGLWWPKLFVDKGGANPKTLKILTKPTLKMMTTFDEALYDANFIETLNNIMMPLSLAVNLNIWWPWRQTLEDDMIKNMMAPTHIGWHLLACPMAHMPWSWGHAHGEDDVAKKCWNKKNY